MGHYPAHGLHALARPSGQSWPTAPAWGTWSLRPWPLRRLGRQQLTDNSGVVGSMARASRGGGSPVRESLGGRGSPERPVVDEVAGSSRLDSVSRRRQNPLDDCNSGVGLRLLGEKKGVRHDPNCNGDVQLWTSPGAGGQRRCGFKSSSPSDVPATGGGS
jgi:hypothetical protein